MGYFSTNALGRTHFGGDVVAGGNKPNRNGVSLDVVSTGSTPSISARGDDSSVGLDITPKGDAVLTLGSTVGGVELSGKLVNVGSTGSTGLRLLGSTRTIKAFDIRRVDYDIGNLSSAGASASWEDLVILNASTVTAATTNAGYIFTPADFGASTGFTVGPVWCSTQGTVRLRVVNASAGALNPSTAHGTLMIFNTV